MTEESPLFKDLTEEENKKKMEAIRKEWQQ
jgi:hypothetical protein